MSKRIIETEIILTGKNKYVAGIDEITAALNRAIEAKKEFDALFSKASNSPEDGYTSSNSAPQ